MPSVKQGGGYTLTFAKKNEDVKELLAKRRKEKGFIVTDYICEAIRFFEENKNKGNNIDIEDLVKQEVARILGNIEINTKEDRRESDLEDNLDDIDINED